MGGLGIMDLRAIGYTLRMRWEWLHVEPTRAEHGQPPYLFFFLHEMFFIPIVVVQLGDCHKALFWPDTCIN